MPSCTYNPDLLNVYQLLIEFNMSLTTYQTQHSCIWMWSVIKSILVQFWYIWYIDFCRCYVLEISPMVFDKREWNLWGWTKKESKLYFVFHLVDLSNLSDRKIPCRQPWNFSRMSVGVFYMLSIFKGGDREQVEFHEISYYRWRNNRWNFPGIFNSSTFVWMPGDDKTIRHSNERKMEIALLAWIMAFGKRGRVSLGEGWVDVSVSTCIHFSLLYALQAIRRKGRKEISSILHFHTYDYTCVVFRLSTYFR